jgi:2-polyprenyl-6-methoxyphenol hydroxylase-like FAD-dependent oxidoreductase
MYDAIVVGARCAGSPTAMLLARQGYRVLLLDRASFPSDTLSTHYIHQPGVAALRRWGLLDRLIDSGCPPARGWKFDVGPFALTGFPPLADAGGVDYCPRRTVLDTILVHAAVAAGAELRENFSVQEIIWDGDRVVGVRGRSSGGPTVTERARIVIGADGMRSFVARSVQAPLSDQRPGLTCSYYSYWSGMPAEGLELYPRAGNAVIVMPTHEQQTCVVVQWPVAAAAVVRADIEGSFLRALEECTPSVAERVRAGQRTERFSGSADLPFFYRQSHGPGWALVGDAGYHQDPGTGQGISDAFRDAELLSAALDAGFSGREPLDAALETYTARREEASRPMYELTYKLTQLLPPSADEQRLFGALIGNEADTTAFFGALAGTVPIPSFFAPENIGRIVGAAMSRAA